MEIIAIIYIIIKDEGCGNMAIHVRVLNASGNLKKTQKKLQKESVILTPAYVKRLNDQITYNILKNQTNSQPDVLTLKKTIIR